jgi:hypothetical protein
VAVATRRRRSTTLSDDAQYDALRAAMEELSAAAETRDADLARSRAEAAALRAELALAERDLATAAEAAGLDAAAGTPGWAGFHFVREDLVNLRAFTLWARNGEPEQTKEAQRADWKNAEASVTAEETQRGASDDDLFRLFRAEAAPYLMVGDTRPFNADALRLIARMVDAAAASMGAPKV